MVWLYEPPSVLREAQQIQAPLRSVTLSHYLTECKKVESERPRGVALCAGSERRDKHGGQHQRFRVGQNHHALECFRQYLLGCFPYDKTKSR